MKPPLVAPFLPQEIITHILTFLPVKSLIRFQCVCKHWKNIIKTPSFIATHLHHSSQHRPCLLFHQFLNHDRLELYLLDCEMQFGEVENIPNLANVRSGVWIVGSSNGLLCLRFDRYGKRIYPNPALLLWNPTFREIRPLVTTIPDFEGVSYIGFGFSSIVNDYKIVVLYFSSYDYQVHVVEVFSLATGSLKKIEDFNLGGFTLSGREGFTMNGAIYWIGHKRDIRGVCECVIVSFDIATEEFSLIPVPPVDQEDLRFGVNFTEFEHRLTLLFYTMIENSEYSLIEMWMLEESTGGSGERWSWTKKCVSTSALLHPITVWRNEIACTCHLLPGDEGPELVERIILSNLTTAELKVLFNSLPSVFNYVESLVPVYNVHVEES